MSAVKKVLVVGGGIGGLSTAIGLRKYGIEVDVVEKHQPNSVYGVGIILPGNALRALATLGLMEEVMAVGFPYDAFAYYDKDGGNESILPSGKFAGTEYPEMMGITRPDYSRILTDGASNAGARMFAETVVTELKQDANGVDVTLSDGQKLRYDAVIGSDGVHSTTRDFIFGGAHGPKTSYQVAWRVNFPRPADVNKLESYDSGEGFRAGIVPLSKDIMYMYVTDTTDRVTEPEGDLRQILHDKLAPFGPNSRIAQLREKLPPVDQIVWKPFLLVAVPEPWYKGRVMIIGDAAHASSAHLGQGGAMAIEDAVVVAEELSKDQTVEQAFANTMKRRGPRAGAIKRWSEQLMKEEAEKSEVDNHQKIMAECVELMRQPL